MTVEELMIQLKELNPKLKIVVLSNGQWGDAARVFVDGGNVYIPSNLS